MRRLLHILPLLVAVLIWPSRLLAGQTLPYIPDPIAFDLPADCHLGETCWVVNYVDVDSSLAAKDLQCQARTYDGHDGIDLAIRDRGVMKEGIPVLASAPGTIHRIRDGVADVGLSNPNSREAIAGRECGNGVVIDHGQGWETQYCHLQQHSIRVIIGQRVERGSELGLIGLSGKTEFSHVHLTVRHDGQVINPFTGRPREVGCGAQWHTLWRDHVRDVALYHAGLSAAEPQDDAIRNGHLTAETLSPESAGLVLWVNIFGVQAEDHLRFRITAPDGRIILDRALRIARTQARRLMFAGLRRQSRRVPSGTYHGALHLDSGMVRTRSSAHAA